MTEKKSINAEWHHVCRPLCPCCGGGDKRKGKRYSKAKSHAKSIKARRGKARHKDHR